MTKPPRSVWITLDPDSVDEDKLTHIALHEEDSSVKQLRFIEFSAYEKIWEDLGFYRREWESACERANYNVHLQHENLLLQKKLNSVREQTDDCNKDTLFYRCEICARRKQKGEIV